MRRSLDRLRRAGWLLLALFLFLVSLELIKSGARPLTVWFKPLAGGAGVGSALGAGWFLACVVLSGSPVAALALGLLDDGSLDTVETLAMVTGSRLGAAFVVLLIGLLFELRGRSKGSGTYVGATALVVTFTVYLPAFFAAWWLLGRGWLDGIRPDIPGLRSALDLVIGPIVRATAVVLPPLGQSLLGVFVMVGGFWLFDRALPVVDPTGGRLGRMATTVYRPSVAFLFGMVLTCMTLSVSASLTLLVPLTARGLVRRENVIPFVLGANVTTLVDTFFLSFLLDNPAGTTIVLSLAIAVVALSLPAVLLFYRPYGRLIDRLALAVTRNRWRLAVFVGMLLIVPLTLVVLPWVVG